MSEECNLAFIRQLAIYFSKLNLEELFLALLLFEKYELCDDIRKLRNKDMKEYIKVFREYMKSKDPLMNPRWLNGE